MKTEQKEMPFMGTPGPWKASLTGQWWDIATDNQMIAELCGQANEEAEEANARLIAKAPDMLSALKAIQHFLYFGEPSKAAKVAEEVLGKIEQS